MKVLIFGAGYVGVSTGVVLSKAHHVSLVDIDEKRVNTINSGRAPIHEDGLDDLLRHAVDERKLRAFLPDKKLGSQDIVLVCVGTPSREDGFVDTGYVSEAARMIIERIPEFCGDYLVIGMKSTVPPGTTRSLLFDEVPAQYGAKVGVVFNPEFLREGSAITDSLHPDRIVIGGHDARAFLQLRSMYLDVLKDKTIPCVDIGMESAEMSKYVSNCFLATKISFANEIANVVETIPGADIDEVMNAVGLDRRISPTFFESGAGFGGSCFPKDLRGFISFSERHDVRTPILQAVQSVNLSRPSHLVQMLQCHLSPISGRKVSVLGVAFKPGTDDTRESPSLSVIRQLIDLGAQVSVHDPVVDMITIKNQLPGAVKTTSDLDECLRDAEACILITDWPQYRHEGIANLTKLMKLKIVIDGRRLFAKDVVPSGVTYRTVGVYSSPTG